MPLTDTAIRNAKPAAKPYKLTDGEGLYLLLNAVGKYWRFDYRMLGKRKTLAIGVYPDTSLSDARERRSQARKLLANNTDPSQIKQTLKQEAKLLSTNTFEAVAREWHKKQSVKWVPKNSARIISLLSRDIFHFIGKTPILQVTAAKLLDTIQKIEKRGNIETAHRAMMVCGQIFRYAIASGRAQADLSLVLKGSLIPVVEKHHASITDPKKIGALLRTLEGYEGSFLTNRALKLAPLLFVRPGELRHAEWSEIDLDVSEWRIPASKMKMKTVHIVPLSQQSVVILQELKLHANGKYVFPGIRNIDRPMSENTVNGALRRMGYEKDEMTGHGFRSMASTILHEQGWQHEVVERQLAHADRNKVSAAYNYAEYLPKRKEMMQAWADYLDGLKAGAKNN